MNIRTCSNCGNSELEKGFTKQLYDGETLGQHEMSCNECLSICSFSSPFQALKYVINELKRLKTKLILTGDTSEI